MVKQLLTIRELAGLLKVSRWTLFSWIQQDLIPRVYGLGRMVRFDPDEIDAWMARGGVEASRRDKKKVDVKAP